MNLKRPSDVALVEYPSSEEEETPPGKPNLKRRKLPPLSSSLTVPTPADDPGLHQGRVRTHPHVEGQYATYVYVPLVLHHKDALYKLVEDALRLAKRHVPSLHAIGKEDHDGVQMELHISLSRPLFLRAHQRQEFQRAIKQVGSSMAPFDASFTTFSELTNDERTRTFLVLDLGAGYGELRRLLDLLEPSLRLLRQREFYVDPKFHTSIAWALLEKPPSPSSISVIPEPGKSVFPEEQHTGIMNGLSNDFLRIPQFPHTLVPLLNEAYAAKLSQARTGGFVVDRISARIGKEVFTWPLNGMK